MTAAEIVELLLRVNLAGGAAILAVIALRKAARRRFGARLAYGLWLLPLLAAAAVLVPARQIVVIKPAAPALAMAQPAAPTMAARVHQTIAMPAPPEAAASLDPPVLLVGAWLIGVAGAALVMAWLQRRFMRQARGGAMGPAVVGVLAPRIVTPRDFADRYSREEQALVLAHEQAHIARQDSRLNGLMAAAQCLCWFNPLVHLAAHLMRIDQELACDEAVTARFPGARRAYAEVLLKAQLAVLPLPLGCYWPSKTQHPLVERVAMLKRPSLSPARRRAGAATLALLCAGIAAVAWAAQPAQVRTLFKAAPVAKGPGRIYVVGGNAPPREPWLQFDETFHDEAHHIDIFKGHVAFNGYFKAVPHWRVVGDLLVMPSVPPGEPGVPDARKVTWEGKVRVDHGDDAARADYAYYDFGSKTLTLTGHVAVAKGRWVAKNDRLVIDAKDLWRIRSAAASTAPSPAAGASTSEAPGQRPQRLAEAAAPQGPVKSSDVPHRASPAASPEPRPLPLGKPSVWQNFLGAQINAERVVRSADQRWTTWTGGVVMVQGDDRLNADRLEIESDPAAASRQGGILGFKADGNVLYTLRGGRVEAGSAVYEPASDTITFKGDVVFHHGQTEERGETLIVDRQKGVAIVQPQPGPSVENVLRRWIAAVQMHQTADAVMSPALIEAARQQAGTASQMFRAFGALQSIRFVRDMPDGVSNYEADFAHGKLNLMVGPLTADGKLDQLRFGPIWAKDGERPRPGVPLAP